MKASFFTIRKTICCICLLAANSADAQVTNSSGATGANIMAPYQVPEIYEGMQDYKYDRRMKSRSEIDNPVSSRKNSTGSLYADFFDAELNRRADNETDLDKRLAINRDAVLNKPSAANYFRLGNTLYQKLEYDQAIAAYLEADRLQTKDARILTQLANAFAMAGKPVEAERTYDLLLKINPDADIELQLVWVRHLQRNKLGAIEAAQKYAAKNPSDIEPYLLQAALLHDKPEAEALLNKSASLNNEISKDAVGPMLFNYAKWLQSAGDIEASIIFLDFAVASSKQNMEFIKLRAETNNKLGRHKQAKADEIGW